MADGPGGKSVACPKCGEMAIAVAPKNSEVVEDEENADGMVQVMCHTCGERFHVHYRIER